MQTSEYTDLGPYVRHNAARVLIPKDPANRNYIEYLDWLADGGVPLVEKQQSLFDPNPSN